MKNTYYFPHDFDAINDIRLQNLIMKMGYEGLGFYWTIVEMLYKQGGKIELSQCESIAFVMRTDSDKIKQLIDVVFEKDEKYFWSNSVIDRLKTIQDKSKKAKQSAKKRWTKQPKLDDAKALQTQSEGNANKEKKSKVNKSKEKKEEYSTLDYLRLLPDNDLEDLNQKYEASKKQIQEKATTLLNYCEGHGKRYKNYRAMLLNALLKDFGYRRPVYVEPEHKVDKPISPERWEELKKQKGNLLGRMSHG